MKKFLCILCLISTFANANQAFYLYFDSNIRSANRTNSYHSLCVLKR
ncbi:MAG: hypothetical protein ACI4RJ_00690 [Alphaproteobacteria bacterium]